MIQEIKDIVTVFCEKLCIDVNNIEVSLKEDNIYILKIETDDSWILIWNHWSVFESLQWIFRNIFRNKFPENIRIHLEINDYIHNRDTRLFSLIEKEIIKAKETWRNMKLPFLSWYERKKVHSYISELNDSEIITESRWEGKERRLFIVLSKNKINFEKRTNNSIKKSTSKLEIDIDWDDI